MSGTLDRLVYMANQIARNLAHEADPVAATADHVAKFWDPRMKAQVFACLDGGGQGLDPVAIEALAKLRARGAPPPQTQATEFGGAARAGGSDAG